MFANKFLYSVQLFLIVLVTELKFLGPIILIINWAERGKKGHINIFYNTWVKVQWEMDLTMWTLKNSNSDNTY